MLISRLNSNQSFGNILVQEGPGEMVISGEVNQNACIQLGSDGQDFGQLQTTESVYMTQEFHMVRDLLKTSLYFSFLA